MSIGPIVFIYIAETLPLKGFAFCFLMNWCSAMIVGITYPALSAIFSHREQTDLISALFIFYGACSVVGFILFKKFVLETSSRTPKKIENLFRKSFSSLS